MARKRVAIFLFPYVYQLRVISMSNGLSQPFYSHYLDNPSRPALFVEGQFYTYGELGTLAGGMASFLLAPSHDRIKRVGILASRSAEAIAGILAAAWAGATFVPLNPKYPEERLISILKQSRLDALILDEGGMRALTDRVMAHSPKLLLGPRLEERPMGSGAHLIGRQTFAGVQIIPPPAPIASEASAYILFTSGTTGVPKGVMVTNANVTHFLQVSQARYRISPDDRLSQQSEITFDHIVFDLFMAWGAGASVHVTPETMVMAPAEFIRRQGLTVWFGVPSGIAFLNSMRLLRPGYFPSLRLSLFAGEPLSKESADAWRTAAPNSRIDNLYGPTEVTVDCLWQPCTEPLAITPSRGVVAIGRPYDGMQAAIVGAENTFLRQGQIGQLAVCGPQVAAGYWDNPELTAQRYPRLHHPEYGADVWYLTGDLSYQDETGVFHYLGRVDNQVKVLGQRVELEDVEFHLREVCQTDLAAVIAWPMQHGTAQGLIAFVADAILDQKQVKELLRHRVLAYMIPRRIIPIEQMPLNLNGKVDRKALAAMLEAEQLQHA